MNPKILDGKSLAKKHEEVLKEKMVDLNGQPTMVSFCNQDDSPSVKYTEMKRSKASDLGINFLVENYSSETTKEDLEIRLQKHAKDSEVDGILIQLPLPENLEDSKEQLISLIPPEKDVDGLTGKGKFLPATIKGVISILNEYIENWKEKKIAVVGSTGEMGGSMIKALKDMDLDPLAISRKSDNFAQIKEADIVISATGQKSLIKPDMIKDGAVLIDIGLGDFNEECYEKAEKYTPVIGGVGPMTVISLMENTVASYEQRMVK